MTNQCKWCDKKGTHSFGWLDAKGEWQDKHLTCADHAMASMMQQNWSLDLEQMRERSRMFGKPLPVGLNDLGRP